MTIGMCQDMVTQCRQDESGCQDTRMQIILNVVSAGTQHKQQQSI